MAQYYFDVRDGQEFRDETGQYCLHEDEAAAQAMFVATGHATDQLSQRRFNPADYVALRDDRGTTIMRVTFAEAIDVDCRPGMFLGLLLCLISLSPLVTLGAANAL